MFKTLTTVQIIIFFDFLPWLKCVRTCANEVFVCDLNKLLVCCKAKEVCHIRIQ